MTDQIKAACQMAEHNLARLKRQGPFSAVVFYTTLEERLFFYNNMLGNSEYSPRVISVKESMEKAINSQDENITWLVELDAIDSNLIKIMRISVDGLVKRFMKRPREINVNVIFLKDIADESLNLSIYRDASLLLKL